MKAALDSMKTIDKLEKELDVHQTVVKSFMSL
jgi:hypothetical protein